MRLQPRRSARAGVRIAVAAALVFCVAVQSGHAYRPAAAPPPPAPAAAVAGVKIKNNPRSILMGQSYTLEATGDPAGGTFTWTVLRGNDQVTPASGTGATFTIKGIKASPRVDDVRIEVEYMKAKAQCELTVVEIKLDSLTFGGKGFHAVAQDGNGAAYGTPHWLDANNDGNATNTTGDRRFPVLYERGEKIAILSLTAKVAPADFKRDKVPVRGAATDTHAFAGEGAIDQGKLVVSAAMTADQAVRKTIWFYNTYDIQWDAALTDKAYYPIGKSDNRVYVTLAAPAAGTTLYETVCELGCEDAMDAADKDTALDYMWTEFPDLDVRRKILDGYNKVDGVRMGYWRPDPRGRNGRRDVCRRLAQMLASPIGDGICSCWAELLDAMTRVQGFSEVDSKIFIFGADPQVNAGANGFLVKSWAFGEGGIVVTGDNGINNSDVKVDDDDFVKKNKGFPDTVCIEPKQQDVYPRSKPKGDDHLSGNEITTGKNGICETTADPADNQLIDPKKGQKNMPCILAGKNTKLDSTINPDDSVYGVALPPADATWKYVLYWTAFDLPGVEAQDNPEPRSYFNDHIICKIRGHWYDPSYGIGPFPDEKSYEDAALAGITTLVEIDVAGGKQQVLRARTKTKATKEMIYVEFDRDFRPKKG